MRVLCPTSRIMDTTLMTFFVQDVPITVDSLYKYVLGMKKKRHITGDFWGIVMKRKKQPWDETAMRRGNHEKRQPWEEATMRRGNRQWNWWGKSEIGARWWLDRPCTIFFIYLKYNKYIHTLSLFVCFVVDRITRSYPWNIEKFSAVRMFFRTLCVHFPSFHISYYSLTIILVSSPSSCFHLAVPILRVSCAGYTPRAWDPRSLYTILNVPPCVSVLRDHTLSLHG